VWALVNANKHCCFLDIGFANLTTLSMSVDDFVYVLPHFIDNPKNCRQFSLYNLREVLGQGLRAIVSLLLIKLPTIVTNLGLVKSSDLFLRKKDENNQRALAKSGISN